jgi:hypothetical protein
MFCHPERSEGLHKRFLGFSEANVGHRLCRTVSPARKGGVVSAKWFRTKRKQITRKLGLSNFGNWVFFLPHSRFINGQSIKGGNKHHETKTNIKQHSGSSIRVPIDGNVRSATSELGLY